ncbi:unnamed protein product [Didymodactylos carnosus]|uniref:Uncharacterized protein n=1 Tax=Didymodactylos carnosus TaxID=1234261 RepID=A0A813UC67_9BILA|nr:unnamed protein product [Didymodactylos carnosus]CAF0820700.1 unnamed protein product [Didymodactylos carnosus]CAF3547453.1 unnamed protein product [Didymodactylos carnosus]CAF3607115.1 unnamed protein product [Didymodactylos carnosus]
MDVELRCPLCQDFYQLPLYLPCHHSLCTACAISIQQNISSDISQNVNNKLKQNENIVRNSIVGSNLGSISFASDLDKLSLISDNDSGVVISSASSSSSCSSSVTRPNSLISSPIVPPALPEISLLNSIPFTSSTKNPLLTITKTTTSYYSTYLQCPVCSKYIYMDQTGIKSLPENRLLKDILIHYIETKKINTKELFSKCQLCEEKPQQLNLNSNLDDQDKIIQLCEQCLVYYCEKCREQYHPMRGPYAKHNFIKQTDYLFHLSSPTKTVTKSFIDNKICSDHPNRLLNLYCIYCHIECCQQCMQENHIQHEIHPISQAAKAYKTQLSTQLQSLSEKAKQGTEFLTKLKTYPDHIKKNCSTFQSSIIKEIDILIQTLETKKRELVDVLENEKERKFSIIKQQCADNTFHIQRTTGFLQFCVEALKESDPTAYLQVCHGLNTKCNELYESFSEEFESKSHTSHEFDLTFNVENLMREIHRLQFQQMKAPSSPRFNVEQCMCDDSGSGTLAWFTRDHSTIQSFVLELDDGTLSSDFREVYCGPETMCAVDGLALNCVYNARVKAYNQAGESQYSECITLHSASVYWFTFNPRIAHPDITFLSINSDSLTCQSYEDRIVLGNVGFRKGVHYWELIINRYDDKPDPAFGVARFDVSKDHMLGKDSKSWCMYIDSERSWFMHNGQHTNRQTGGIGVGSVIGLLLDLNNGTLSFYVNDEPQGPIAFTNLHGVFYPAVSLNKNVHMDQSSDLVPPMMNFAFPSTNNNVNEQTVNPGVLPPLTPSSLPGGTPDAVHDQKKQEQQIQPGLMPTAQWPPQMYPGYPPQFMFPGYGMPYSAYPPMFPGTDPNRPPSRQSVSNDYPSSSRSIVNGSSGGQPSASSSGTAQPPPFIPQQYPGYINPGMANPWFDPYWAQIYSTYPHPYGYGYADEMMKHYKNLAYPEDDRYSYHSNYSQTKASQHSSLPNWGSVDSLNDQYYQNGFESRPPQTQYQQPQQQLRSQHPQRVHPNSQSNVQDQSKLLLTTTKHQTPAQQVQSKKESSDEDEDSDDSEESQRSEDDASSDRFSIKSDLAGVVEPAARRTPFLFTRPHLRVRFSFDQMIKVLPQSPSDTEQPATVEIVNSNSLYNHSQTLADERQILMDFIGPLTASTAKQNVIRYCEKQAQSVLKTSTAIDKDALSLLWQYMALLVKTNATIDVRVDIPKLLWTTSSSSSNTEAISNDQHLLSSPTINNHQASVQDSLREFLALGEIDNSIKCACDNHLYTHALIIAYQTDERLFKKTMNDIISNLGNGDVLKTFYELGSGLPPSVVTNVTKPHYGDWRRHLAVILANRTESNASFVDQCIKTMGDTLGSSGRLYSSHFCYLISNVPFGSYRNNTDKFALLGSAHVGQSYLSFAQLPNIQLTEVYEYAIRKCYSLPTFTPLKIYYASRLILHGLRREALSYCGEIGQTLLRQENLTHVQLSDLQLLIMIGEKSRVSNRNFQLDPSTYKDPTWLVEIRRVYQTILQVIQQDQPQFNGQDRRQIADQQKYQVQPPTNQAEMPRQQDPEHHYHQHQFQIPSQPFIPNSQASYPTQNQITADQSWYQPLQVQPEHQPHQEILQSDRGRLPSNEVRDEYPTNDGQVLQNGHPAKKSYSFFEDEIENKDNKIKAPSSTEKSDANSNPQQLKSGMMSGLWGRIFPKKLPQAHLPDDKNKTLKFDEKTRRWIDTSKSAAENEPTSIKPPPLNQSFASSGDNPNTISSQQPPHFNSNTSTSQQLLQPAHPNSMPNASFTNQPQTRSVNFNSATTTTVPNQLQAQPVQPNVQIHPQMQQSQLPQPQQFNSQMQSQQQQPALSTNNISQQPSTNQQGQTAQLSQGQQRLQNIREKQKQQQQQMQMQTSLNSSNQYSLKSRQNQSRYVDILASKAAPVNPNLSLNDFGATLPTSTSSNYFIPDKQTLLKQNMYDRDVNDAEVSWINFRVNFLISIVQFVL